VKNPADFIGPYIGQSEERTKKILATTVGKVLVIDEVRKIEPILISMRTDNLSRLKAYMLYGGSNNRGPDTFKAAIIDTLVAEIQNVPGDDRCVLLLGYKAQMEEMFQVSNQRLQP